MMSAKTELHPIKYNRSGSFDKLAGGWCSFSLIAILTPMSTLDVH